eukprot:TRINITY_DN96518_c0_g1_i1.p1 TRINITY_DN96518_c0_g1~~TRINITY_DN96518_c0_g1_i1.p1  ORF type:complete len:306 (-),score=60.92 TRINITY_DN96518_c0_g1_i1:335-1225(-)
MSYLRDSDEDDDRSLSETELEEAALLSLQNGQQDDQDRAPYYDVEGLHDKLEDFGWSTEVGWDETLVITNEQVDTINSVDDDLERELAFYNQGLAATKLAIAKLQDQGIAWARPDDYYAEMVKTDDHMSKIKQQLVYQQQVIQRVEEKRKAREAKKFARMVSAEKKQERAKERKIAFESVKQLRKQRAKSGYEGDLDFEVEMAKMESEEQQLQKPSGVRFQHRAKSMKKQIKDSKYGFGGPKRMGKKNDAISAADTSSFRQGRFKVSRGKAFQKGKGKAQRPGKARRQQTRGKKRN